ncbi:MAG: hypothetical protein IIW54_12040 [Lachnospiraceae bacterium]|nr:hypothetical protein [Lachnospiraceae bacterium]
MTDNKHQAVWDWLLQCPELMDMYFNFGKSENGDTIIAPETAYNDTWKEGRPCIGGGGIKYYDFALIQFQPIVTEPNNTENIDILLDFEKIASWIDEQEQTGNYPVFPDGETVLEVGVLESPGGFVSGQDEKGAKYMLQVRIEYLKEKE